MPYEFIDEPQTGRYQFIDEPIAAPLSRMDKVAQGMKDPINGGAQLLTKMLPDGVVSAGNDFNNWLSDKTGLVSRLPSGGVDQQVKDGEAAYQASRAASGESGFDGYRTIGNVASPANLALATKLPVAASLLGRVGVGTAGGAATSAINPIMEGDFWKEKAKQVGIGALSGGVVPMVTGAIGRAISPNASVNPNVQMLRKEGVTPTFGQAAGGWANALEEKAQSIPFVGDSIGAARMRAREQFNNAAINRATAPLGVKVSGSGTEAVAKAGDLISDAYTQAKSALGGFKIDQQGASELANLRTLALASNGLQGREKRAVSSYFTDYLSKPGLTSASFKELDSKLNSDIAKFSTGDAYQKKVGEALQEVQRIITDNAHRANPKAAELFKNADKAWANLVRVEGASVAGKSADGVFTPGQLLTAVRGADKSVRDRATARGAALMQDFATAGQSVLGNKIPDSGSPARLLPLLTGGAAVANPMITGAGLLGGMAMYTKPMQGLLSGAVSSRPQAAKTVADALRNTSPALIPFGAQFGLGLLNQ